MLKLARYVAEGVTAKLDFDYACNRGHSFTEYYLHGIVNEILGARTDPNNYDVCCGYAPPQLKRVDRGRNFELDFAILNRKSHSVVLAAETKWAASSHCSVENVLQDLIRLQLIANTDHDAECFFLLSGPRERIERLFRHEIFKPGTRGLLTKPGRSKIHLRKSGRKKNFPLDNNANHQKFIDDYHHSCPKYIHEHWPQCITTSFASPRLSATEHGRFHSLFGGFVETDTLARCLRGASGSACTQAERGSCGRRLGTCWRHPPASASLTIPADRAWWLDGWPARSHGA
jgi:hypothetical protein